MESNPRFPNLHLDLPVFVSSSIPCHCAYLNDKHNDRLLTLHVNTEADALTY